MTSSRPRSNHGRGLIPCGGTFLVIAGQGIGAMCLSVLSELGAIGMHANDLIGLGEDGPIRQPVETLANRRGFHRLVIRRGDGNEPMGAYQVAVTNHK